MSWADVPLPHLSLRWRRPCGTLHDVIPRMIETRRIVNDRADRESLVFRIGGLPLRPGELFMFGK